MPPRARFIKKGVQFAARDDFEVAVSVDFDNGNLDAAARVSKRVSTTRAEHD
jgi:hypothetical protein